MGIARSTSGPLTDNGAPYFVDLEVPKAVLLPEEPVAAQPIHPNACGAVWYKADEAYLICNDTGTVQQWLPQEGVGETAIPSKPNTDNLRLSTARGLQFEREVNAGMVIKNALVGPSQFSCAVRYTSDTGDARTLLTVNPTDYYTYLFLTEKDGRIRWQDQKDQSDVSVPAPRNGGWIVVGFDAGKLSLTAASKGDDFGKPVHNNEPNTELANSFSGANDIFVGCRSHRKGILKTLGSSRLHDLLLWIDQDICNGDQPSLNAACRYCEAEGTTQ